MCLRDRWKSSNDLVVRPGSCDWAYLCVLLGFGTQCVVKHAHTRTLTHTRARTHTHKHSCMRWILEMPCEYMHSSAHLWITYMLAFLQAKRRSSHILLSQDYARDDASKREIFCILDVCFKPNVWLARMHSRSKKSKCKGLFRDMCTLKCSSLIVCDTLQLCVWLSQELFVIFGPWQNQSLHGHSFHLQTAWLLPVSVQSPRPSQENYASKDASHIYPGVDVYRQVVCWMTHYCSG